MINFLSQNNMTDFHIFLYCEDQMDENIVGFWPNTIFFLTKIPIFFLKWMVYPNIN
jgi:hypothetical protein